MRSRILELNLAGSRVRVALDTDAPFGRRFGTLFPCRPGRRSLPCPVEIGWRRGRGTVLRNGRRVGGGPSAATLSIGEWVATTEALRGLRRRAMLLHAAWVVSGRGSALLVGSHGAGKTLLSIALALRHGWSVRADDVVTVNRRGGLRALERPLRLKPGGARVLPELRDLKIDLSPWKSGWPVLVPLGAFGTARRPAVRAIFVLDARRSGKLRVRPAGEGTGLALLARYVSNFRERPAEGMSALARLVHRAPVWRLSGGSLDTRCEALSRFRFR